MRLPFYSLAAFPVNTRGEGIRECGVQGRKGKRWDNKRSPCRHSPASYDRRAWRNDSGRRGAASPPPVSVADLGPRRRQPAVPAGRAAQRRLVARVRTVPTPGGRAVIQGQPTETQQLSAETEKLNNVAQDTAWGTVSLLAANYSTGGTRGPKKRLNRSPAPRDTGRPRHASLPAPVKREQDASRPANELSENGTCWLAKPRSVERGYRGREANALNGDPRVWTPSHQRSGGKDPLSSSSESPRTDGRGEMLVDPSEQPNPPAPAPGSRPTPGRSNLQQEQACPGLRSTGDIAASAAGLWSSLPRMPAISQPL